jgi:hypothetical protein
MIGNLQTFAIPCGDHIFDFSLTAEETQILRIHGINFIQSATCPICQKVRILDAREMLRVRAERESAALPSATEAAYVEVLAAVDGDAKRVDEREVRRLAAVKADAAVEALGKAKLEPQRAPEQATVAEWDMSTWERGISREDVLPVYNPDITGVIDSTGGKK